MARLNPYLNFRGNAREVMEFYHSVFGGDLTVSTFADFGAEVSEAEAQQVMHSQLETTAGYTLMASDVPESHSGYSAGENAFSVSLSGGHEDNEQLTAYFTALAEGGTIVQPLVAAPWGDTFGMLADRFGVNWLVNIAGPTG